ncbi:hypothetical protein NKR19_g5882 [Coniochaeta hoffmannii]|uniref:Uncharacterized protein n=1 Tax=Coniochaeta hoffmannii TaxID=91930 RepID=A0AA38RI92_9PEZI|nr:hypothetical protein NKR19_g5882 [Coniochaeta hoffmannii]
MEWAKEQYNKQYENWVPWLEDLYLRYFTKDNKASYTAKQELDKTKVTGISQVDTLQDGVNGLVAGQVGQGGMAQPVGDMASREGMTRAERQGKDDSGGYLPGAAGPVNDVVGGVASGGQKVAGGVQSGLQGAGGLLGIGGEEQK